MNMVLCKRDNLLKSIFLIFFFFILAINLISFAQAASFEVGSVLMKVSILEGSSVEKKLTVYSENGGQFSAKLSEIKGVGLSETSFVLEKGESKTLSLVFDATGLNSGVYVGNVLFSSVGEQISVPIIFEIESKDLFFDSNLDIPPQYQKILPTGKLVAQVRVFDLTSGATSEGLGNSKLDVDYKIYSVVNGQEISTDSESIVVNKVTQITKTVSFGQGIREGLYVFSVVVKYKSSVGVSSYLFEISNDINSAQTGLNADDFDWKFLAALIVIFFLFLSMVFLFVYLLKDRDKLMVEMRNYNNLELKRQKEFLLEQARLVKKRKLVSASKVNKDIKSKMGVLKKEHKKRLTELKSLKKKGDTIAMMKKMKEWKMKGYSIASLDYKMDSLSKSEMSKIMDNWRAKGYKLK